MKNIEKWKDGQTAVWKTVNDKYRLCLLIVNVIVLVYAGIRYGYQISDLACLEFSKEQMQAYTTEKSISGSIDGNSESGLYDIIPSMFLKKGYYCYTVQYEGSSEGSFCWPHSYTDFYDVMEEAIVTLSSDKTEETMKFWLNADLDIALRLYYSGEGSVSFTSFRIEETNVLANIELFQSVVFLAGLNLLVLIGKRVKKKSTQYVMLSLLAVTILASFPPLTGYFVDGDDLRFHLTRIEGIRDGLLSGQFPVRIAPTFYNGYGYANPIFYGELLLYFPAFLRLIGFSVAESYNAFLIVLNALTAFICYFSAKKIFSDDMIAVTTTLLYVLCPYRLLDLYGRAAIGEATAMTFLPLVAYGIYRIFTEDTSAKGYKHVYLTLVLGLTGIIQSHVITGEMTGGFILLACVFCFFKTLQKKRFFALVKTVVATVLVNVWFLVPFLDFMLTQNIKVFVTPYTYLIQKSGLFISQIFSMFTEYSKQNLDPYYGMSSEMPMSLGLSLGLGMLLSAAMLWVKNEEQKHRKKQGVCFLILAVISIWMATLYFPWDRISTSIPFARNLVSSIQFAWRFLGIAAVLAALVTGYGLLLLYKQEGRNALNTMAAMLVVLSVVSAMNFTHTTLYYKTPLSITENTFKTENIYSYAMAGEYVLINANYDVLIGIYEPRSYGGVQVTDYEKEGTNIDFSVKSGDTEGYVLLPLLDYKGYTISSEDGVITDANLQMGDNAVIRVNIPENYTGTISLHYKGFWYWRVAELISVITVGYLIFTYTKRSPLFLQKS